MVLSNVHDSGDPENLESLAEISLLLHLLEFGDVDQLDNCEPT